MERKGRWLVGRGRPVNDSVNDFCSSLSGGQSPRAAANQGPRWAVTQQPLLSGPPKSCKPLGAREWGPGAQEAILSRAAGLSPKQPAWPRLRPGTLRQAPRLRRGPGPAGGARRLLSPRPSWRAASWGAPTPPLFTQPLLLP